MPDLASPTSAHFASAFDTAAIVAPFDTLTLAATGVARSTTSDSNAALLTFLAYSVAVFALAWFAHRILTKRKFLSEYYLGSRSLGVLALTLSYGATSASAGSFVGFPAFVYAHGWIVALWIGSYMLVPLCGMGLLGKRLNHVARKAGAITLPDMFRGRFESRGPALLATAAIIFMLSFYLIPQFKTASIIMGKLFEDVAVYQEAKLGLSAMLRDVPLLAGLDAGYLICLGLFAVLVVFYTTFGGFRAVVWTDVLQGFVMIFGVVFMLVVALMQVGGLGNATRQLSEMTPPRLGSAVFILNEPPPEDGLIVPPDTWLELPGDDGEPRLLRTNYEAVIPAGKTRSNTVKLVQITTPGEIEKIRASESFRQSSLPDGVSARLVAGWVTFRSTAGPLQDGLDIPSDTWFFVSDESHGTRLVGTTQAAMIGEDAESTGPVAVEEIIDPQRREEIVAEMNAGERHLLPTSLAADLIELRDYAAGANQPGVYVTGPGPHFDSRTGFLPFGLAISFFFFWALSGTGQPGNMVRLMAADSSRTIKRSIAGLALYYGMIYFPLVIIFVCARIIVPGMEQDPDRIMPELAFTLADAAHAPWVAGLLVAAPFAAAMSTVDSFMLMISSSVVRDIYQRDINPDASPRTIKLLSYACTMVIGLVVMIGAIDPPQFLQYLIVFTGGGLAATFLLPVVLTLYWRRINTPGVIAAMLGGLGCYLALYVAGFITFGRATPVRPLSLDPLIWGFAASLVFGLLFSLATPPPPRHLVRKFFYAE